MGSNWIDIVQSVDKGDTFVLNFVSLCPVQSDPPILIKGKKSHPILSEFGKKIEALKSFWPHTNAIKFNTSFTRASGNFVWRLRYEDNSTQNFNLTITSKPSSKTERIFNLCVPNNAVVSGVPTYNIEQYINEDDQSTATQNNEHELNCSPHGSVGNEMAKNTDIEEKNLEPVSYHEDIYGSKWFLTDSGNLIEDNSTSGTALPIDNFHTTSSQPLFTENNANHNNNNSNHHSHNRTDPFMAYFDSLSQAQQQTNNNLVQPLHTGINSNQEHDTPNSELASASLTSESGSKEKTLKQPGFEPDDGHTHIGYQHYQSGVVRQETQLHIIPVDLNNSNGNGNNNRSQQHNGKSNHRGVLPPQSLSNGLMPGQSSSNPLKRKRNNTIVNNHNVKKPKVVIKTNNYFTVNEVISTSSSDFDRSDESQSDSEDSFCVRCGYTNHSVEECYATRTIDKEDIGNRRCCYRCGHPGHFAPNCYARKDKWGNRL